DDVLGGIGKDVRAVAAKPIRRRHARHVALRAMLDALFRPAREIIAPADDEVVACRCEEVAVGTIRQAVALGCLGPNQVKSYTRTGMGPCQGRMCGLTIAEVIAAERGVAGPDVGHLRIRPPIKPLTIGEVATFAGAGRL